MMNKNISVDDFIKSLFIRRDELSTILGYNVSGNSIKAWLLGKYRPPKGFEETCKSNGKRLIEYSDWKLREGVFEKFPKRKPQGFWEIKETHRYALEWLCKKEGWEFPYGLYQLNKEYLCKHNIDGLTNYYSSSPVNIVTSVLSEYDWKIWKFHMTPMSYWEHDKNKVEYLKWFEKKLNISSPIDWYKVSMNDLVENYGSTLFLTYCNGSIIRVARILYPKFQFYPWKFIRAPKHEFDYTDENNLRYMIDTTAKEMGFEFPEGFYGFKGGEHFNHTRLGKAIKGGMCEILRKLYPDHEWYPWLFEGGVGNDFWKDEKNIKAYGVWLEQELAMTSFDEWYDLNSDIVGRFHGGGLLAHGKGKGLSVFEISRIVHPTIDWDPTKFEKKKFTSQKRLFRVLKDIYTEEDILYNSRHRKIKNPKTNRSLELDCYLPSLNLAFEFQGKQHYEKNLFFHSKSSRDQYEDLIYRDKIKEKRCRDLGINLIKVSKENWDFTREGLISLIDKNRK